MEQRLWMILQLFGGAALFLYSMDTLTDALQQAAGDTLRQALARLTAHPLAGVLTGAAVTAVVQSSSAVTVLVLGLVGAGLLTPCMVRIVCILLPEKHAPELKRTP